MAFLAAGVLPTCAIAAAAVMIRLPAYQQAHERALAARLGCDVRIGAVTLPRPGTTRYERLDLVDSERNQLLARLPRVELRADDEQLEIDLTANAVVNGGRLDAFWRVADEILARARSPLEIRLTADEFTVHLESGDLTFSAVDGHLALGRDESRLVLQGRRAGQDSGGEPVELSVVQRRARGASSRRVSLVSGAAPLPCTLVASIWPEAERLGAAGFVGQVSIDEAASSTKVEASGRLIGVDLEPLMRHFAPHRLSGVANVNIDQAAVIDGRLVAAAGNLAAGPGTISPSLIEAAEEALGMKPASEAVGDAKGPIAYDRLSLAFVLEGTTVAVGGMAGRGHGAVLVQGGHVLLRESDSPKRDVLSLVRLLAPPATHRQMPVARQTDWLARVLPLPPGPTSLSQPSQTRRRR